MTDTLKRLPRLVIAAPQGRSGKTTLSLGLCAALRRRGLVVQPFKKGPDYIDPSWLSEAAGNACRSIDPFFLEQPEAILKAFVLPAQKADLSLVEGNHGLFDSFDEEGTGSTAAVARLLQAPVILVLNAARTGRSAAAIVHGCQTFEPGTRIAGVVLNHVARGRHESRLRSAIEHYCGIPVLGALPASTELTIPDRHLGLVPRSEDEGLLPALAACAEAVERHVELEALLEIARDAPALAVPSDEEQKRPRLDGLCPRIGVMRDQAFSFYYPENLEALEAAGAEVCFINALEDEELPDVDALYIGGGFPEIFMDQLFVNKSMREAVRRAAGEGLPIYAECGGMMYLSKRIVWGRKSAEMAGVLPCEIEMTDKPQGHGYVSARVDHENPFYPTGTVLRGHEFHNSRLAPVEGEQLQTVCQLTRGMGVGGGRDALVYHNVLASYMHVHSGGVPAWAAGLVERARAHMLANRAGKAP